VKQHPPILLIAALALIVCYLRWSLITGSLRIRGIADQITRQTSPREYCYYMRIILVIFGLIVGIFIWMFW
jgi:hypothetical protein